VSAASPPVSARPPTAFLDTTDLTPAELREELRRRYGEDATNRS
jgi:hypothetical protein